MLVSFPGSGNTWTRLLIEDVTGYYTGSVYFDKSLYNGGFIGEKEPIRDGTTIVVKNHDLMGYKVPGLSYAKGIILLVRNPYDAILAEFNRRESHNDGHNTKHTGWASKDQFNTTKWSQTVEELSYEWVHLYTKHANQSRIRQLPLNVIFYEDLKLNSTHQMELVLNFMKEQFKFHPWDALRRLQCLSKDRWYKSFYWKISSFLYYSGNIN